MNENEYSEFIKKYCEWCGDEEAQAKVSLSDKLAMSCAIIEYIDKVKPVYDKYHEKKRKPTKTANMLDGYDFAENAIKGIIRMYGDN